jgi:hypothetical protein
LIDIVNCANINVLERGGCFGFVHESLLGFRVACEVGREELKGDGAIEPEVLGFVDDAHTATAEVLEDFVVGDRCADQDASRGIGEIVGQ